MRFTDIVSKIVKNKIPCYFISPHFDDAVFSAGGLISFLSKRTTVVMINIFTKGYRPSTFSGKKYLYQCGYTNVEKLFDDRRKEDMVVNGKLGVKVINLDFIDAQWRKKEKTNVFEKFLGKIISEPLHIYPTYKLHIIRGIVAKNDVKLVKAITDKLLFLIGNKKNFKVFCPLAVGKHIDHIIVRDICCRLFKNIVYWADFPYSQKCDIDKEFVKVNNLKSYNFSINFSKKSGLILGYRSQVRAVFPEGIQKLPSETYYLLSEQCGK